MWVFQRFFKIKTMNKQQRVVACLDHMRKDKIYICLGYTKKFVSETLSRHKKNLIDMTIKKPNPKKERIYNGKYHKKQRLVPLIYPSWYLGANTPSDV